MTKYKQFRVGEIKDYPLESRPSKVDVTSFASPVREATIPALRDSFPDILAASHLKLLVSKIQEARKNGKSIIWGFGGHLIKVGLAPVLIDLLERGFVTSLATNGSGMIHDFEIAVGGRTSEEVEEHLNTGAFGMARETGEYLNRAIVRGAERGCGIGESVGEFLDSGPVKYPDLSLFIQAYRREVPVSVLIAMGTDIIFNHPSASGEAIGKGSQIDYHIFAHGVSLLNDGGVYLNIGSSVVLPEVFLKAVSLVRNSGQELKNFTTANLDFIQHYRPTRNVVERPVAAGGTGIALTGHHELMVPLLAALLIHG